MKPPLTISAHLYCVAEIRTTDHSYYRASFGVNVARVDLGFNTYFSRCRLATKAINCELFEG